MQYVHNADAPKLEADPESKMGRKLPQWLSTLIEKHQASVGLTLKSSSAPEGSADMSTLFCLTCL